MTRVWGQGKTSQGSECDQSQASEECDQGQGSVWDQGQDSECDQEAVSHLPLFSLLYCLLSVRTPGQCGLSRIPVCISPAD